MSAWPSVVVGRPVWPRPPLGWIVEYSHDFRADATATLSGTYEASGVTFTLGNEGNADTYDILAGTGMRIAPARNVDYAPGNNKTAPYLEATLTDFFHDLQHEDRLLFQFRSAPAGLDESGQGYGVMIGNGTLADRDRCIGCEIGHDGTDGRFRSQVFLNTTTASEDDITLDEPRVFAVEWRTFVGSTWYHASDGLWRPGDLTQASKLFTAGNFKGSTSEIYWPTASNILRIFARRPDTATSDFTFTLVGLRVLRQRD